MKTAVRWAARLGSLVLVTFVGFIFIGEGLSEGFPNPIVLTLRENVLLAAFFLMVAGLVLAWRWAFWGAVVTFAGYMSFSIVEGRILPGVFSFFPAVAGLFIWSWLLSRSDGDGVSAGR